MSKHLTVTVTLRKIQTGYRVTFFQCDNQDHAYSMATVLARSPEYAGCYAVGTNWQNQQIFEVRADLPAPIQQHHPQYPYPPPAPVPQGYYQQYYYPPPALPAPPPPPPQAYAGYPVQSCPVAAPPPPATPRFQQSPVIEAVFEEVPNIRLLPGGRR